MSDTPIKVRNAVEKIKFTCNRLNKFISWDAPKNYMQLKERCIISLKERLIFLQENAFIDLKDKL